jgi:sugar phosphate permease
MPPAKSCGLLASVIVGYIGVYLCRKNLSVAIPMIHTYFGATKAQTGDIISYSAAAYAIGKFLFGPVIDRFGGRRCFLAVLLGVAVFGALGGLALSLPMLAACYTANRFCGSAGWGAIIKQTTGWFPYRRLPLAIAFLSLSFVFGGICALMLAGQIAAMTQDSWRMVMGLPSLVLAAILLLCWQVLPGDGPPKSQSGTESKSSEFQFRQLVRLARSPQLWVVCAMAFSLYIMRETFNNWTVDFFKTESGAGISNQVAAWLSTPFDAAGAAGILAMGWLYGRLGKIGRRVVLVVTLTLLAGLIYWLPWLFRFGLWAVAVALGLIGFLSFGPFSLLAGVFAVEIGGAEGVGTVAGTVDSAGYLGTIFAGHFFGRLLDTGGYRLGFHVLALVTVVSALLCCGLKSGQPGSPAPQSG